MSSITAHLFDFNNIDQPYKDMWEYYEDCTSLINLKLISILLNEQKQDKDENDGYEMFDSGNDFIKFLMKSPAVFNCKFISDDYIDDINQCEQYLFSRRIVSINAGLYLPDIYLANVFGLSPFEHQCLLLSFVSSLDPKYERVFALINDNPSKKYPTVQTCLQLFTEKDEKAHSNILFFLPDSKLMSFFFSKKNIENSSYFSAPLVLHKRITRFLMCSLMEEPDSTLPWTIVDVDDEPEKLVINSNLVDALIDIPFILKPRHNNTILINLFGAAGSGKKLLFRHFCKKTKRGGMIIDCLKLPLDKEKLENELIYICRESIIRQSFICLDKFDSLEEEKDGLKKIHTVLGLLSEHIDTVFASSEKEIASQLIPAEVRLFSIEVASPDTESRIKLWQWFSREKKLQKTIDISELSSKFNFTPGQIRKSLDRAVFESELKGLDHVNIDILYDSCYRQIVHNLTKTASLIKPAYSWNDLVLPPSEVRTLKAACNHVKYGHKVFNEWGFSKKVPYGRGLSMLFSGPPGTGKTMSAQVVAHELHMEMYKIQLSKIISKYIGETEKNLKEIFDEANKSNVILFFDETDALFGKRSEVKDSHDRYANIEVAYLLQQIEEHEGITIMATNYMKNIDEAFLRRINYIIHFPFPDEKARHIIWEKIFPENAPVSKNVDYGFLARKFEISGGNIKNIAISSAFQAASENSEITMNHIIKAAIHEQKKNNKVIIAEDLEEYADLL
ncbi:MAG: AAA family ATPase [Acetivibrionales bacterium]|jgi:hypothetical protein